MKTFFIKYPSGKRQIMHSLHESVEAFCRQHFGTAWDHAVANGASVRMTDHDQEASLTSDAHAYLFEPEQVKAPAPPPPAPTPAPSPVPSGDAFAQLTGNESSTATGGAGAA